MNPITGTVWKFGDDINTDLIAPGRYMSGSMEEIQQHVLEAVNPAFAQNVKPGDIIIAGNNFGCGSSREEAPAVLKACGIAAIVAESFARIFFRNAIAIGLPVITCNNVFQSFEAGETVTIDIDSGTVTGNGSNSVVCESFPSEIKDVLEKGGILPMLKEIALSQNSTG